VVNQHVSEREEKGGERTRPRVPWKAPRLPLKPDEARLSEILSSGDTWKTVARERAPEHAGARVLPASQATTSGSSRAPAFHFDVS
jgi:hypothetical protein